MGQASIDGIVSRRSANYHPPIWDYDYVQSLRSDFVQDESYKERARKLKEEVRMMLGNVVDPLEKLELIDTLQRLALSYHFESEINKSSKNTSTDRISTVAWKKDNLYATALELRLLRQHGYKVDQDVFTCFMNDVGNIKSSLNQDFKGLLNLYEASYLLLEGEIVLGNARELVVKLLEQFLKENPDHQYLWMLVDHALELPLHWRMPRLEARWFIDVWWKELGLGERFNFARDRLMGNFLLSVGMIITPQDGKSRRIQTKINALITVIDDVYDVYGTLDELELFTDWTNLCKSYLLEAIWYYIGYTPTLQEYIDNTWISIAGSVILAHSYLLTDYITEKGLHNIQEGYYDIIYRSSIIVRLANDLATSLYELKRCDVPKSIQCYMYESRASEEEACMHIRKLIDTTWKKINENKMVKSPFSPTFIEIIINLAKLSLLIYQNGDGLGNKTKDIVLSIFVHPIFLPNFCTQKIVSFLV
ncbi:hypothetical protein E1A91_D05G379100v1 [Gossypium mustelinum]|uniref:Uncharacterized protein n=1 Tax=Gossypium mustelinum TaxID=34275 RepID=A0A5D2V5J3_GOSMU|nr:hypothetical protein E1A91_D05G379100v1 [Gossypium mustelinum]